MLERIGLWSVVVLLALAFHSGCSGTDDAGKPGPQGADMPPASAQTSRPAARRFNSELALEVYAVVELDEEPRLVGRTPAPADLEIPHCLWWYVEPAVRPDLPALCKEIQAKGIPGLSLRWASDQDLSHLKGLTGLQVLGLSRTEITDGGLEHLKGLTGLQELDLGWTEITDAGLEHLKGLTGLQTLILWDTQVTYAGCEKLQRALPGLSIFRPFAAASLFPSR